MRTRNTPLLLELLSAFVSACQVRAPVLYFSGRRSRLELVTCVLCLDVGTRRTGVAVSNSTGVIAQGLPTLEHKDEERLVTLVAGLIREWKVTHLVVGLPLSPDGNPTSRSEAVTRFANRLRNRFKLPVEFQDERWSSNRAADVLAEARGKKVPRGRPAAKGRSKTRKRAADRIAAVLILEDWLAEASPLPGQGAAQAVSEGKGEG
ncbi:MAG TPA: Holliday junction resolvase RuvX [candidate division WOR-3 bacterium]|uniref:Putative pre-16S rRNA nuclease n=1 Tax=candidate division WOR-3 bacterium TaxID=2052148 RepID=A0A7V0XFF7_UNCW3|nr:Holliday junction resolvase RuvX [candidate division WOR-3 bacterium]